MNVKDFHQRLYRLEKNRAPALTEMVTVGLPPSEPNKLTLGVCYRFTDFENGAVCRHMGEEQAAYNAVRAAIPDEVTWESVRWFLLLAEPDKLPEGRCGFVGARWALESK